MRVFCPEHHLAYLSPRRNPVKCASGKHVLGEFDFAGSAKLPVELRWSYCCNCGHFWPAGPDGQAIPRCPVCSRQLSHGYVCDRCYTLSLESSTPVEAKNFSITMEGEPQPSCPVCLQSPTTVLDQHQCRALGILLATALSSCPICKKPVTDPLEFPCRASEYLDEARAGVLVGLDYDKGRLVPMKQGPFLLLNGSNTAAPFVLPTLGRFSSRREFYDQYQDYYYCELPEVGELVVEAPALVEKVDGGWQLKAPGRLKVLKQPLQKQKETAAIEDQRNGGIQAEKQQVTREEAKPERICSFCNTPADDPKSAFCWHCGEPLEANRQGQLIYSETTLPVRTAVEQTLSARTGLTSAPPAIFAWASEKAELPRTRKSAKVVVTIGLLGLILLSGVALFLARAFWGSRPPGNPTNQVNLVQHNVPTVPEPTPSVPLNTRLSADEEITALRQQVANVSTSDRSKLLEDLQSAEQRYPNDYRFPYERAKLSITGRAHHDAFGLLFMAGRKAIDGQKPKDMLGDLARDKDRDFYKLSRGHAEWGILQEALTTGDKNALMKESHH